jgi:hypothetical protein
MSSDANDVLYVVNKYIKWKNSARKSYIRKKVLEKDLNCDITQLCYKLYDALENKHIVINDTQENIDMKRKLLAYEMEIARLKEYETKYDNSHKQNIKKRNLINELNVEIENLKLENSNLKNKLINTNDKCILDEPTADINDNYDYTKVEDSNTPLRLSDFTSDEIYYATECETLNKWNTYSEIEKIKLLQQYYKM